MIHMAQKLSSIQIQKRLKSLPEWKLSRGNLHRSMKFSNFVSAFAFMTAAALEAEKMNHHPEWSNVYSSVEINLQTHSAKGITALDFELAGKLERIARTFLAEK